MEVRCPQCHHSIDLPQQFPPTDVVCPSCGSSVSLLGDETQTYHAAATKTTEPPARIDKRDRVISHYRLDEIVGAGGMGEVYRAHDLALGRDCALKVLRSGVPSHLRDRLLREAQTGARLQHPGIATFFEAGEAEGEAFIAMEYVVGQTLRERLRQGPLSVDLTMTMTARLLEALGHAHALGILHRDIKPENVMLADDGSVKLLDFGIAKDAGPDPDVDSPTLTSLTQHGAIIGTVGYMSPEQVRGETLDARTDLFSVGAVLYEMIAGQPAFPGATPTERIAAILSKDPEPLAGAEVLTEINAVLSRALDRDPASRYESASAFMRDLGRAGFGELAAPLHDTVAVLDFENLSHNPDDDWIGAALAESLTADLSRLPGLDVPPRQKILGTKAARKATGAATDPQSLGLALSCRWLATGTFHMVGSALRLTVRLTEVLTNHDVLTEKVDGSVEALFEMQDRLASVVGDKLNRAAPSPEQETTPAPKLTAYECYVKGQQALGFQRGSSQEAREFFKRAVDLDPEYAPALTGLAAVEARDHIYTTDPTLLDAAEDYARRAIAADPGNAEARMWLGYVLLFQDEWEEGYQEERRAMELDPTNFDAPYFSAGLLLKPLSRRKAERLCEQILGKKGASDPHRLRRMEGLRLFQRALELNPRHGFAWLAAGMVHTDLSNFRESRWCLEKAVELEKTPQRMTAGVEGYLGECLRRAGQLAEAREQCMAGIEAIEKSDHFYRDTFRGIFLCSLGRTALQQEDTSAARAAFNQAALHLRGRRRARGGGHPFVQALCGLVRSGRGEAVFEEAQDVFRRREGFDFGFFWCCTDDLTLLELARAARRLDKIELSRQLLDEAIDLGSVEALSEEMP